MAIQRTTLFKHTEMKIVGYTVIFNNLPFYANFTKFVFLFIACHKILKMIFHKAKMSCEADNLRQSNKLAGCIAQSTEKTGFLVRKRLGDR